MIFLAKTAALQSFKTKSTPSKRFKDLESKIFQIVYRQERMSPQPNTSTLGFLTLVQFSRKSSAGVLPYAKYNLKSPSYQYLARGKDGRTPFLTEFDSSFKGVGKLHVVSGLFANGGVFVS